MHKKISKFLVIILAIALAVTALVGCSKNSLDGNISGDVTSNGGFIVQKGEYVYFINGLDDYDAKNNGSVVKSALMRIKKTALDEGKYDEVETVVDSLLVAGSYSTGVCIFGDYVYYATPTNTKNKDGKVENSYLDFKRTKLDGTDTTRFCRAESRENDYRFIEKDNVVYIVRIVDETSNDSSTVSSIYSYNTSTKADTRLAFNVTSYAFDADVEANTPYIYYTMSVYKNKSASTENYNQLYRVSIDATSSQYGNDFNYDKDVDDDDNDINDFTYVNYGTLVLDGIGKMNKLTEYNYDTIKGQANSSTTSAGYNYSIVKYENGGLYYTREFVDSTDMDGNATYKLIDTKVTEGINAGTWNSVAENYTEGSTSHLLISYVNTSINESTLFYTEDNVEHFILIDDDGNITNTNTSTNEEVVIATNASGATFLFMADGVGGVKYLYYSLSNGIYRVGYNGTVDKYNALIGDDEYKSIQILDVTFSSSWYAPEIIDGKLFYTSADSDAYSYVYVIDLKDKTNANLKEINEIYDDVQEVFADLQTSGTDISNAAKYYYLTGDTTLFNRYDKNSNYTKHQRALFDSFVNCTNFADIDFGKMKVGENVYNLRSSFVNMLGVMSEDDVELQEETVEGYLLGLTQKDNGLGGLIWLPITVSIVLVGLTVTMIILKKKRVLY